MLIKSSVLIGAINNGYINKCVNSEIINRLLTYELFTTLVVYNNKIKNAGIYLQAVAKLNYKQHQNGQITNKAYQ